MPLDTEMARRFRRATRNLPALYAALKRIHHARIARAERRHLRRDFLAQRGYRLAARISIFDDVFVRLDGAQHAPG